MNLFNKSAKNTFYNSIGFFWPVILNLTFTPYIVNKLGADAYGIMGLTTVLWGYFAFLDMGLGSGNVKYISEYVATKQIDKINKVINTLLIFYTFLGLLGFFSIFYLSEYLTTNFFNIPSEYFDVAIFAFHLSAFGFFISIIKPVFDGIPKALSRFDILNKINLVFGTVSILLVVGVIYFGYGLAEVLIVKLAVNFFILVVSIIVTRKLLPSYKMGFTFEKSIFNMLFNYGVWEIVIKLSNLAVSTLGKLIISVILGPAALTYYLIPQNLTSRINTFNYKLSEIIFPISSELSSTNNTARLNNIYLKMTSYSLAFKLSIYIPLLIYSYKILFYWIGKEFAEKGWLVLVFLGMGYFFNASGQLAGFITYGLAKIKLTSKYTTLNFLILIVSIYPLIKFYGIIGAGLSYFISSFVYIPLIIEVNKKILYIENKLYIKKSILLPVIIIIPTIIFSLIMYNFIESLESLLLCIILSFLFYNLIAFLANIYPKEQIFNLIKKKNGKRS